MKIPFSQELGIWSWPRHPVPAPVLNLLPNNPSILAQPDLAGTVVIIPILQTK